ncbi:MAG: SH3 domain-containing protein [Anaerolineae bacterium]|nr:SH3 domain-containing protein [Candidatus Roseilinea sp.]MDW8448569.1 SH3 domain-containing protein [Anaerolineae bacterium]
MRSVTRALIIATISALSVSAFTLAPHVASAQTATLYRPGYNLLINPGHEHPGVYFAGRGEINVTWGWLPFWEEAPPGVDPRDPYFRTPEFRPVFQNQYPYRVHSGGGSDRWFNFFALNKKAGIMQYVINLPIGAPIRFTSWLQLWSSNLSEQAEIPPKSIQDGNLKVRVCIDQDGGPRDMTDPNLVCSDWAQPYDRWQQISVDGVAMNSAVNVLIWSSAEIPVEHNDIYADDSCFEILPAPGAKGICLGQGFIETGPGVVPPPEDVINIKASPQDQAKAKSQPAGQPALTPVKAPTGTQPALAVNARSSLNLRAEPDQKAKIVGNAKRGAILPVLGKSKDGKWFQVEQQGKKGWVLASLTLPNAAARAAPVIASSAEEAPGSNGN